MTITGSTFAGNQASFHGTQIYSTVTISNSTFTGGGGYITMMLTNGTITDSMIAYNGPHNYPGVSVAGAVTVTNSIVAGNGTSAASTENCVNCTLQSNNVIDIDPQLSTLGSYGGLTQTIVPLPASPAICTGKSTIEADGFYGLYPAPGRALTSSNSFAVQTGGGVDVGISRHLAVRLFQADWLRTQLPNSTTNVQNNLRLAAGIVFRTSSR